jgi:hypothetical protein
MASARYDPNTAGGGRSLIASVTVGADNASTTLATGLNGDLLGCIEIEGVILNNSAGQPVYTLQPNGISANQSVNRITSTTGSVTCVNRTDLMLMINNTASAGADAYFLARMTTKTGFRRYFQSLGHCRVGGNPEEDRTNGEWADTSTVITSLVLVSSSANGIGAGSKVNVYAIGNAGL